MDAHVVLDIEGLFFVYPLWDSELHPVLTVLSPAEFVQKNILDFELPDQDFQSINCILYDALTYPGTTDVIGSISTFDFLIQ